MAKNAKATKAGRVRKNPRKAAASAAAHELELAAKHETQAAEKSSGREAFYAHLRASHAWIQAFYAWMRYSARSDVGAVERAASDALADRCLALAKKEGEKGPVARENPPLRLGPGRWFPMFPIAGRPNMDLARAVSGKSGAYAIRDRDGKVLYVGQSSSNILWKAAMRERGREMV